MRSLLSFFMFWFGPLHFSSPKMPSAPAPLPADPMVEESAVRRRADEARAIETMSSGRRTTMYAGRALTDEKFRETMGGSTGGSKGTPKKRGASSELGVM